MSKDYLDGFKDAINIIADRFTEEIKSTDDEDVRSALRNGLFIVIDSVKLNMEEKMHERD